MDFANHLHTVVSANTTEFHAHIPIISIEYVVTCGKANATNHPMEHVVYWVYPLVNEDNYGKSPFLLGISTINGHFQ